MSAPSVFTRLLVALGLLLLCSPAQSGVLEISTAGQLRRAFEDATITEACLATDVAVIDEVRIARRCLTDDALHRVSA